MFGGASILNASSRPVEHVRAYGAWTEAGAMERLDADTQPIGLGGR